MRLENIVLGVRDTDRAATFWSAALGLRDLQGQGPPGVLGRLDCPGGVCADICLEPQATAPAPVPRLHLDLLGGDPDEQAAVVRRLVGLGATPLDIGQGDVPWVVLADPDGNPFCVMEERAAYRDTGPIAALPLDSADPERDAWLYAALTGWVPAEGVGPVTLRHPGLTGPLLELCPEPVAKRGTNRTHLDVRPEPGGPDQAELVELALTLGATRSTAPWAQGHSWVVLHDISGNEFCVLADEPS